MRVSGVLYVVCYLSRALRASILGMVHTFFLRSIVDHLRRICIVDVEVSRFFGFSPEICIEVYEEGRIERKG